MDKKELEYGLDTFLDAAACYIRTHPDDVLVTTRPLGLRAGLLETEATEWSWDEEEASQETLGICQPSI